MAKKQVKELKIKLGHTFTDDHLPCFGFKYGTTNYELWWTSDSLYGKLELVESGDITLKLACKKYPQFYAALTGSLKPDDDEEYLEWFLDAGYLKSTTKKK